MASPRTRRVLRELKFKDGNNVRHYYHTFIFCISSIVEEFLAEFRRCSQIVLVGSSTCPYFFVILKY